MVKNIEEALETTELEMIQVIYEMKNVQVSQDQTGLSIIMTLSIFPSIKPANKLPSPSAAVHTVISTANTRKYFCRV